MFSQTKHQIEFHYFHTFMRGPSEVRGLHRVVLLDQKIYLRIYRIVNLNYIVYAVPATKKKHVSK